MTYNLHFSTLDEAISPQPWMQRRTVATEKSLSVSRTYDPADGQDKNDLVQTLQTKWTNNTPISQWVRGEVTISGRQVTLQSRSRGYLSTAHGYKINTDPADTGSIGLIEVSRMGCGVDLGNGGLLALGGGFGIAERRENSGTSWFMPHQTGRIAVNPGETIHARIEVRFISENWENTMISGGDSDTEAKFIAGDLRLDLKATPAVIPPKPRLTPTVVGGSSNVKSDRTLGVGTEVTVPTGVAAGDILLAIVCNQLGLASDIEPEEDGWMLLHSRGDGLKYWEDVHAKVFMRTATASEPATYSFGNALAAEEIAVLMAIRNADAYDDDGLNWYAASDYARYQIHEKHIAPTLNLAGGMLICFSFMNHSLLQSPVTFAVPSGMTLLKNVSGNGCTMSVVALSNPPNPTVEREFIADKPQNWITGHSVTASILIPGKQQT